jgi:hypothetical protein
MTKKPNGWVRNRQAAKEQWGPLSRPLLRRLREITSEYGLSVAAGEVLLLEGRWYVTHAGLLRLASRRRCSGIRTEPVEPFCDATAARWVFRATVYKSAKCKGFIGYGDADPGNVSSLVRGAEVRMAETRAVNRALRKAYAVGLCSVEELGSFSATPQAKQPANGTAHSVAHGNGTPRLRDRLSQLIRQYGLDPALVKQYAADFCGTSDLKQSSRQQVEQFVNTLAEQAHKNREALLCQLNGYAQAEERAS